MADPQKSAFDVSVTSKEQSADRVKEPDGVSFMTVELSRLREGLPELHHRIVRNHLRVEVTCDGSDECCVIISKAELESLERALEIFAGTTVYQDMCQIVQSVVVGPKQS